MQVSWLQDHESVHAVPLTYLCGTRTWKKAIVSGISYTCALPAMTMSATYFVVFLKYYCMQCVLLYLTEEQTVSKYVAPGKFNLQYSFSFKQPLDDQLVNAISYNCKRNSLQSLDNL